jgi:uncharacterized protein (TIGR02186 family)
VIRILTLTLAFLAAAGAAFGQMRSPTESVEFDVSMRDIFIGANFTGIRIIVFGTIDYSRQREAEPDLYDVVAVIRGPSRPMVARRKARVAGIWVNTESRKFQEVPSFYAVLSSKPLKDIAPQERLEALGIGFDKLRLDPITVAPTEDGFRRAVIRLMQGRDLFQRDDKAMRFIGRSLFRGSVDLPANVTEGSYTAEVYLFRAGQMLSRAERPILVNKIGLERFVHAFAFQYPFVYGLFAVLIAVTAGLLGSILFRRD